MSPHTSYLVAGVATSGANSGITIQKRSALTRRVGETNGILAVVQNQYNGPRGQQTVNNVRPHVKPLMITCIAVPFQQANIVCDVSKRQVELPRNHNSAVREFGKVGGGGGRSAKTYLKRDTRTPLMGYRASVVYLLSSHNGTLPLQFSGSFYKASI
ncbi:hypothetical protein J6590_046325 [Homalodisca vitripennis]|nr:hypothetical protein J6590_046325 [Homalodisca vitripennis]